MDLCLVVFELLEYVPPGVGFFCSGGINNTVRGVIGLVSGVQFFEGYFKAYKLIHQLAQFQRVGAPGNHLYLFVYFAGLIAKFEQDFAADFHRVVKFIQAAVAYQLHRSGKIKGYLYKGFVLVQPYFGPETSLFNQAGSIVPEELIAKLVFKTMGGVAQALNMNTIQIHGKKQDGKFRTFWRILKNGF